VVEGTKWYVVFILVKTLNFVEKFVESSNFFEHSLLNCKANMKIYQRIENVQTISLNPWNAVIFIDYNQNETNLLLQGDTVVSTHIMQSD
jgi:hypothetical protein